MQFIFTISDMFRAGKDFEGNVDQLLMSAKVAATIPLYKPHWFSKLHQTRPEDYVNEQTNAKMRILEVICYKSLT